LEAFYNIILYKADFFTPSAKDDLEKVLDAVRRADVLVMASPIYYGEVASQIKAFIDRTYSFLASDYVTNPHPSRLSPGKKMVFILTQG